MPVVDQTGADIAKQQQLYLIPSTKDIYKSSIVNNPLIHTWDIKLTGKFKSNAIPWQ